MPVASQRVLQMEADNGLLLPILPQAEIAGNPTVVLVHLAVAFPPIVKLAGGHIESPSEPPGGNLGLLLPALDEIHDLVKRIVRNPDRSEFAKLFFVRPAPPSVLPGPHPWSGSSSPDRRSTPALRNGWAALSAERQPRRSGRTPSASGRRPWAEVPVCHTAPRSAPAPVDAP